MAGKTSADRQPSTGGAIFFSRSFRNYGFEFVLVDDPLEFDDPPLAPLPPVAGCVMIVVVDE